MKLLKHFKAPVAILAVFLLLILLIYILVTQTNLPERLAARVFEKLIGQRYNLTISVGDIGGSLISNLEIRDLQARYASGDNSFLIASLKNLRMEYSLADIWRGRWIIQKLCADTLEIGLRREFLGQFRAAEGEKTSRQGVNFQFEKIDLKATSLRNYDLENPELISGLNLHAALSKTADSILLRIDSAWLHVALEDFAVEELRGTYLYHDSLISIDSAFLGALGSRILFSGDFKINGDHSYKSQIHDSHFDLARIGQMFGINLEGYFNIGGNLSGNFEKVGGQILLDGSLFGNRLSRINTGVEYLDGQLYLTGLKGGAINSTLQGDAFFDFKSSPNQYLFSGRMLNFNLNSLIANTFQTSFSGEVIIDGRSFSSADFVLNLQANLDSGYFDIYNFDSLYGYAEIFMDSIRFDRPLTVEKKGGIARATGLIEYNGQIDIEGHADFTDITPLIAIIRQKDISGRGSGDFSFYGPLLNPQLTANFTSDSVVAYGFQSESLMVDVALSSFALYQQGQLIIESGPFRYGEVRGDSAFGRLIFDSNMLYIDTLRAYSRRINANLAMDVEFAGNRTSLRIPSLSLILDTFHIVGLDTLLMIADDSSLRFEQFRVSSNNGILDVKGTYFADSSLNFSLDCSNINIQTLTDFYLPEHQLRGLLGFEAALGGTLEEPLISVRGEVAGLDLYGYHYGDLYFKISYHDSLIQIDSLYMQSDSTLTRVEGTIPYNLAFLAIPDRTVPFKDIDLEIGSRGAIFLLLPVILPDLEWIEGEDALDLKLRGSLEDPEFSGSYYLRNGRMKIYYLENILTDVKADVSFEDRYLLIDSLTAISKNGSKQGTLSAGGRLTFDNLLRPEVDIDLLAEDFPIKYDLGDIEALIDKASLKVTGQDTLTAAGKVDLASFLYSESFVPEIKLEAIQAADTASRLNYIIDISAPSNIKVENPDFNVEVSGDLRIFREGNFQNFYGNLETIRGKYNFIDQSFTILPGGEILFDDIEEFNPHLNIELETNITSQGERQTANLLLSGTLLEPTLTATENSEVSENQFFEWLTFQRFQNQGDTGAASFDQRLSSGAAEMALGRLTQLLGKRLGLGNVEFNPAFQGDEMNLEESQIRIGMYTTPGLYIYGTTQLDFSRANEVGFEYRFSRHWFLSGHRDQGNLYHLNLNLNWDF